MRVRKLSPKDANGLGGGDFTFGHGNADYLVDDPLGVAQTVKTRLGLFVGDFFLDATAGTPWRTNVLGKYTGDKRDVAIRSRILTTPGVTGITAYGSVLGRDERAFTVKATIDTAYGRVALIAEPR